METLMMLGVLVLGIGLTVWTISTSAARKTLTASAFAWIFAIGSSLTVLALFFLSLVLQGTPLELESVGLGLGAAVVDFVVGFPLGYLFYAQL